MPVEEVTSGPSLLERTARALLMREGDIAALHVIRRSLDARKGRPMGWRLVVEADLGAPRPPAAPRPRPPRVLVGERVLVAGSGPAGTFAALRLVEAGAEVTICELGRPVQPRRHDLARLVRKGELDPTSNYCFGEGGAGTFSDGKLYTRTKDREATREVLRLLVEHGADPAIEIDSRPHVGSNKLPLILTGLRRYLESLGVVYRFGDPLEDLVVDQAGNARRVTAGRLRSGAEVPTDRLILAVGHSARATYEMLVGHGVAAEARPFAVGARIEHPQPLIDRIQYGEACGRLELPAAFYHVTAQVEGGGRPRGAWSFCMCPGGWIVDSSTEPERLVTNGMSLKRRDSPYANAALVVTVEPGDAGQGPLAGVELQRRLEERAYRLGGGGFVAPAQRVEDFLAGRATSAPLRSSYRPRVTGADLAEALPPFVVEGLKRALPVFERTMRGFVSSEAQLVGVETRTSAPLRFLRDRATCQSLSHERLYPCGEGAGWAGGIVSAAIDGLRVADAILAARA